MPADQPRDLRVDNDDTAAHELRVRVTAGETTVFERSWELKPDETARVREVVTERRVYRVTAWLDGGEPVRAEWDVSPSVQAADVTILEGGRVDIVSIVSEGSTATDSATETPASVSLPYAIESGEPLAEPRGLTAANDSDRAVGLWITVTHDGAELFDRSYKLQPGDREQTPPLIGTTGTVRLRARRERTGTRRTVDWIVSADGEPVTVRVTAGGDLAVEGATAP